MRNCLLSFLNFIKAEAAQINGSSHRLISHFLPEHTGQNEIILFLIQIVSLVETFLLSHTDYNKAWLPFFLSFLYFSEQTALIHGFPPKLRLFQKWYQTLFF